MSKETFRAVSLREANGTSGAMVSCVGVEGGELGKKQPTPRDDDYFLRLISELQLFSLGMQPEPDDIWLIRQSERLSHLPGLNERLAMSENSEPSSTVAPLLAKSEFEFASPK